MERSILSGSEFFAATSSTSSANYARQDFRLETKHAPFQAFHVERLVVARKRSCMLMSIYTIPLPLPLHPASSSLRSLPFCVFFSSCFTRFLPVWCFRPASPSPKWETARHRINDGALIRLSTYFAYGETIPVQNLITSPNFLSSELRYIWVNFSTSENFYEGIKIADVSANNTI